jgi:hypothetical protein
MTILLILITLGCLGAFFVLSTSPHRNWFAIAAGAAALLAFIMRLLPGSPENLNYLEDFEYAVGHRLGQEIAAGPVQNGTLLILAPVPDSERGIIHRERLLEGVMEGLGTSTLRPVVVEDENLPSAIPPAGPSGTLLVNALRTQSDASMVLSLIGVPQVDPGNWPAIPLYARDLRLDERLRMWLRSGKLKGLVIVEDEFNPDARPRGRNPQADFDLRFQYLRP